MTNYHDVAKRWIDRAMGWTDLKPLSGSGGRMYSDHGDRIWSYGSHFEMGRLLRNKKGERVAFLLNGDRYSPTTTGHQSHVRSAVAGSGLPSVILPYSALTAAGIVRDTVEIVHVQPDRLVTTEHEYFTLQPAWQWRKDANYDYVDLTEAEMWAIIDKRHAHAVEDWERHHQYALNERDAQAAEALAPSDPPRRAFTLWGKYLDPDSKPSRPALDSLPEHERRAWRVIGHEMRLYTSQFGHVVIDVEQQPDGRIRYSWTTTRHWLGGALIRAKVDYVTNTRCRTCKGTGWKGEPVPRTEPDWFEHRCGECSSGRRVRHQQRQAYFLSDFDHNEPRELYFFCELPRGAKPTTMEEALDALKPDTVRLAEQMGRTVHRQGDIFAVATERLTKRDLTKRGATFVKMGQLLGTNHVATETAHLPSGQTLVRGTLHHRPSGRRPDHVRVRLNGSWHLVVKNTVPISVGG